MKNWLVAVLSLLLLSACAGGSFQIPKEEYQSRVQVLGVLPVLVDAASGTDYPQQQALFDLLTRTAEGTHAILSQKLKEKKGYFDVRTISANPHLTSLSLLAGGTPHNEYGRPLGYKFDPATVAELAKQNVVDALLVVVLSAEEITENRRSRTMLESLRTEYSDIIATAAVIDRQGNVLWTLAGEDSFQLLTLEYPDFDEAYHNRTDRVQLKYITLGGLERALGESSKQSTKAGLTKIYDDLFNEIVSGISPGLLDSLR